jgi:hypothetical protein
VSRSVSMMVRDMMEGGRRRTGVVEVGLVSSDDVSGIGRHGDVVGEELCVVWW